MGPSMTGCRSLGPSISPRTRTCCSHIGRVPSKCCCNSVRRAGVTSPVGRAGECRPTRWDTRISPRSTQRDKCTRHSCRRRGSSISGSRALHRTRPSTALRNRRRHCCRSRGLNSGLGTRGVCRRICLPSRRDIRICNPSKPRGDCSLDTSS